MPSNKANQATPPSAPESRDFTLRVASNEHMANLCGQFDEHIKLVEQRLGVDIHHRGESFRVEGSANASKVAEDVLNELLLASKAGSLSAERVHLVLQAASMAPIGDDQDQVEIHTRRVRVACRGANQQEYIRSIRENDLTFGEGPAGTGKTYLAVASAVEMLESEKVRRLVLVRPAVEAGERLGFLPGDLTQKVDPYLRPIYDALYEFMGFDRVGKLIERNVIEIAPLAFMRGRTLNHSCIIMDEAQNTTQEQMKMFLTRIGFGSKAIVTGDVTQVDLPRHTTSGLRHVLGILNDVPGIGRTHFEARDVVRHPLVQKIVTAYAAADRAQEK